ncbi:MAG: M50 family metallopeptidase [Acidobacteriota bacterium]|nr:M50 family metallopeptidase [Acidobacteriota bacterium]MDH3523187.1 M50 family metallopeptidase [Acidobacteriota bacterium]
MPGPRFGGRPARRREVVLYAVLAAAAIAWLPWLGPLAYPFRLLSTLVHELGHGLAALATGGEFRRLVVAADGSGLAYTAGGWRLLVVPAGYLGTAVFAGGLVLVGASPRAGRWALAALGALVGLASLRYGLPSLVSPEAAGGALAVATGLAVGAAFVAIAARASAGWILFTVHLVAIEVGLAALADLWTLIGLSGNGAGQPTDARAMAEMTWIPAIVWAIVWALAAAAILAAAIRAAWGER